MFLFQLDDLFETLSEHGLSNVDGLEWLFIIGALIVSCAPIILILIGIAHIFTDKDAKLVKKLAGCKDPSKLTRNAYTLHSVLSKDSRNIYKLSRHERFLCLKRLEQLKHLARSEKRELAELYIDWFEDTDCDLEGALRSTKAVSDDGNPWGTLQNAILLYDNGRIKEAFAQFRKLINLDHDSKLPLLLNETQGPEAAWYIAQIMLKTADDNDTKYHAYNWILQAALFGYEDAIEFYRKPPKELLMLQLAYTLKYEKDKNDDLLFKVLYTGECDILYFAAQTYMETLTEEPSAHRNFLLCRLAERLGSTDAYCALGLCYYSGLGTRTNLQLARDYFLKAIEDNDTSGISMYMLGQMDENDNHLDKAIEWYKKSALAGYSSSAQKLVNIYDENGDWDNADKWREFIKSQTQNTVPDH